MPRLAALWPRASKPEVWEAPTNVPEAVDTFVVGQLWHKTTKISKKSLSGFVCQRFNAMRGDEAMRAAGCSKRRRGDDFPLSPPQNGSS